MSAIYGAVLTPFIPPIYRIVFFSNLVDKSLKLPGKENPAKNILKNGAKVYKWSPNIATINQQNDNSSQLNLFQLMKISKKRPTFVRLGGVSASSATLQSG